MAILLNTGEINLELESSDSFALLKQELGERLREFHNCRPGTRVSIHTGEFHLSSRQVREIEDILLDYGFYLKQLTSNRTPDKVNDLKVNDLEEDSPFDDMPYYQQTAMVCRNLRSGQKLFSEGNLVVLGDVNPGAEVIAAGNILILGSLRGMAHAGAYGDETAIISAYRLEPTQLRIANHITRPPDGVMVQVDSPELARIKSGKVIIEKLKL